MASPVIQFKRGAFANLPGLRAGEPALTTDTYELYVGIDSTTDNNKFFGSPRYWTREGSSTGSGVNLVEGTSTGSDFITLKSPDSLSGITTYTFPATPTDGYFLKTNSSGTLSWAEVVSTFDIDADSGTKDTVSTGATITFAGGTNVNTAVSDDTITVNLDDNISLTNLNVSGIATIVGVATFTSSNVYIDNQLFVGGIQITGGASILDQDITARNLNLSGIATVTGQIDGNGGADISGGETTLSSATVSDLTAGRVVLAGTSGALEDSGNLTFDGSTLTVTGEIVVNSGVSTFTGLIDANGGLDVLGHSELDTVNVGTALTSANLTLASGATISAILDEDNFASDSASAVPTQQSTKAYVDGAISGIDLTVSTAGDSGTGSVSTSQTLTVSGTANEIETAASGQSITIGLPNDVTIGNDLTVSGNLYVNGSTTQVNTSSLTVEDRTIELGLVNGSAPSSATTWDLGVLFNYHATSAKKAAVAWEHADGRFKFASEVSDGGGADNDSPQITFTAYAPIEVGALWVNDCAGQSQVISCTGTTRNLENITIDAGTF